MVARFALRFTRDESGATAVEYGLIITLIFLAIVGAVGNFSNKFITVLNTASATIGGAL